MKIGRIKDFVKSFFYYPKMKRYFRNRKMEQYDIWKSAIKYAWWHCNVGKLKQNDRCLVVDNLVDVLNDAIKNQEWNPAYQERQIPKGKEYCASCTIRIKEKI